MKKPERQTYFSRNCQGTRQNQPGRGLLLSLFIRQKEYRSTVCFCQDGSVRIMSQKCNLKAYNTLRPILGLENPRDPAPSLGGTSFCYNRISSHPPEWRYRLGVRTEDSQSSNPGSIPGSATTQSYLRRNPPALPRKSREIAAIPHNLALE